MVGIKHNAWHRGGKTCARDFLKPAHFNNDQQDAQQDKFTNKKANVLKS